MRRRVERYEVVIVGGGQAGLAAGYWLSRHDVDFIIVDAGHRVGDAWRARWDSLQLFTPARYSGLPGLPFPGDPNRLPHRDEVADYLEWYACVHDLPIRHGVGITRMERRDGRFELHSDDVTLQADNVIVATGPFHTPRIPAFASELDAGILQLHSSRYRNPEQLPDGDVLIVGAANSGAQIALEVSRSRRVVLAGESVGHLPRRLLGRDIFDWLWPTLMRPGTDTALGHRLRARVLASADRLIGMSEAELTGPTLRRGPRVVGVRDGWPMLADGEVVRAASVVWCTGFRPDFGWIDLSVVDDRGEPRHVRGASIDVPGLYFVGLRFQHRLNSSLIGGVGADARHVVAEILARYGHTRTLAWQPARGTAHAAAS